MSTQSFFHRLIRGTGQRRQEKKGDPQITGLSVASADQLRHELTKGFTALGYRVSFSAAKVVLRRESAEEMVIDLHPLIDGLRTDASPHAVATWARSFITAAAAVDDASRVSLAEVYRTLRVVLMPNPHPEGIPLFADHEYQPNVSDAADAQALRGAALGSVGADMLECLAFDTGAVVVPARLDSLCEVDDVESLRRAGRANLRQELSQLEVDIAYRRPPMKGAVQVWICESPSGYLSASVLLFEEFLAQHLPQLNPEAGVLCAVPVPNLLIAAQVNSGENLVETLETVTSAAVGIATSVMPRSVISPCTHLYRQGHFTTVSSVDNEGTVVIIPDDYLTERLGE